MRFHNFDEMATRCLRDAYKLVRRAHEIVRNPNVEGCRLIILLRRFFRTGHMYILSLKMYTASALTVSGLYGALCLHHAALTVPIAAEVVHAAMAVASHQQWAAECQYSLPLRGLQTCAQSPALSH